MAFLFYVFRDESVHREMRQRFFVGVVVSFLKKTEFIQKVLHCVQDDAMCGCADIRQVQHDSVAVRLLPARSVRRAYLARTQVVCDAWCVEDSVCKSG